MANTTDDWVDLLIVGGGVGGSTAAKFAAMGGLDVLFIEKEKTPRHKPCSGIQLPYFENIIGEEIPSEVLCNHQIERTEIHFPSGRTLRAKFHAFSWMRNVFDEWLNQRAQEEGAAFRDECEFLRFEEIDDGVLATIAPRGGAEETIRARYVIDASGLSALPIRRALRPGDFSTEEAGGGMNHYIAGDADLDQSTMYQFWDLAYSDAMFAWIYTKTLDDGNDYWVVGTGCEDDTLRERQQGFYDFVRDNYGLTGEIVRTEEYTMHMVTDSADRVWLGQGRALMVGDAAGLLSGVRGVGQDAAAMSGRLAAQAILLADERGTQAIDEYSDLATTITAQARRNQRRAIARFDDNAALQRYLIRGMLRTAVVMGWYTLMNRFRPIEKTTLLPP